MSGRGLSEGAYNIQLGTYRFQVFDVSGVSTTTGASVGFMVRMERRLRFGRLYNF